MKIYYRLKIISCFGYEEDFYLDEIVWCLNGIDEKYFYDILKSKKTINKLIYKSRFEKP